MIPLDEIMGPSNDLVRQSKKEFQRKSPSFDLKKQSPLSPANVVVEGAAGAGAAAVLKNSSTVHDCSGENKKDTPQKYHVVFSTSCTDQQHWESMVFFYHAYKVHQPGTVTRIVSGCSADEAKEQDEFFAEYIKPMRPNGDFHLHHTPDYSRLKLAEGQAYKYMNKRKQAASIVEFCVRYLFHALDALCSLFFISCFSLWAASLDGNELGFECERKRRRRKVESSVIVGGRHCNADRSRNDFASAANT
jgi:hypothetical protein